MMISRIDKNTDSGIGGEAFLAFKQQIILDESEETDHVYFHGCLYKLDVDGTKIESVNCCRSPASRAKTKYIQNTS